MPFVTVREASKQTGYAHGTIRAMASRNQIQSLKEGRMLLVCLEDVKTHMAKPRKRQGISLVSELKKQVAELTEKLARAESRLVEIFNGNDVRFCV